jgi:drug/metabolite transporter (DMT)-like permease
MPAPSDYLKLHFIVFLWGFTAVVGLLVEIPAIEMVLYRTLVAAMGLGLLLAVTRRKFNIPLIDILKILATGFIVSAHWITFFASARVSNASVSLVGFATGSLWTAFLEPMMNRRKIKGLEVLLGMLVIVGLFIIYHFDFRYPLGLFLGVLSGLFSAIFFVINEQFGRRMGTYLITFYEMTGAFVGTAIFLFLFAWVIEPEYNVNLNASVQDWIGILFLGLVCSVYAYSMSVNLMKKLSVFFIQLTLNLEPVYGIILAVLVFGQSEKMTFQFYTGTLIILSAVVTYPILKRKFYPKPLADS